MALGRKGVTEQCKNVSERTINFSVEKSGTKGIAESNDLQDHFQMKFME